MIWRKVKLGEISINIQTGPFGSQLHQSDYETNGLPVIMPKDIVSGSISESGIARVGEQMAHKLSRHKVAVDDIVYPRRGNVAKCAIIGEKQRGWLCGTGCLKVTIDKTVALPLFVYYQLQSPLKIGWIEKHTVGSTMPNLNTGIISQVPIEIPTLNLQHKIASILSAYDNLIDNYRRQIKLLEEAAQRLYKEWFVDLHFPGYEHAKIVDGVPEGWEKKRLRDVANVNQENIAADYPYNYVHYVDLGSVNAGRILAKATYNKGDEPGRAKRRAKDGDTIWGMVRPNMKSYALVQHPDDTDVFSTGFAIISPVEIGFAFLHCYLTTDNYVGYLVNCTNGAAYPAVKPCHFEDSEIIVPTDETLKIFEFMAQSYFRNVYQLERQITLLTEARDRLLPRLMSGEIKV